MKTLKEICTGSEAEHHLPYSWAAQGTTTPAHLNMHLLYGTQGFGKIGNMHISLALARECVRLYAEVERLNGKLDEIAGITERA